MIFGALRKKTQPQSHPQPHSDYLNLGCGAHFHEAWVNVDLVSNDPRILAHDLRQRLPFANESFRAVYHSHVLEHLPRRFAPHFLAECRRVLRPGGILRVAVPDLETIARLYLTNLAEALGGDAAAERRYEWMTLELLDQLARDRSGGEIYGYWQQEPMPAEEFVFERTGAEVRGFLARKREGGIPHEPAAGMWPTPEEIGQFRTRGEVHLWMYDRLSLRRLLEQVGFVEARVCAAGESRIANFASFQLDTDAHGAVRKPDSLFMEASKPA